MGAEKVSFINDVMSQVLRAFYKNAGAALLMAFLFIFFYDKVLDNGFKNTIRTFFHRLKNEKGFLIRYIFFFYTFMLLFETLLCRPIWGSPLTNVIGIWGLRDGTGQLYTENIENFLLFVPFSFLVCYSAKESKRSWKRGVIVSILLSITIEFLQLFLKIGTFQLSDLFYNTIGGFIGGLIYWIGYRIQKHNKHNKHKK